MLQQYLVKVTKDDMWLTRLICIFVTVLWLFV